MSEQAVWDEAVPDRAFVDHAAADPAVPDQLSRVFAALADPTRRDLVARLAVGDATVGTLAAPYGVTLQAVSKHLKVLEDAGLVTRTKDAQRRPAHLEADVFELMTKWIERYRRQAEARYARLDEVLADLNGDQPMQDQPTQRQPHQHPLTQHPPMQDQLSQDQASQDRPKQDSPQQDSDKQNQPHQDQDQQDQFGPHDRTEENAS